MQRWKEEFVANTHRKLVHIHQNGDFEHDKVLYMEPDWDFLDFLNAASTRLNMVPAATRVFNADGAEVDDCMMIEDDDILFLSNTDDFIPPADLVVDTQEPNVNGRPESEKVPSMVGGYKVGDLLGRGGFGEVRVGEHHLTGERVALKFLRKSEIHSFNAAERTNTEIQCLQALKHTNIIRLQQHMESTNHVVLVFELMEGGDLLKYLIRRQSQGLRTKANLTEDEARLVFYQILSAVSYAHNQHICHRDLKLENILLKENSLNLVKIADFGLSDFYRPGALIKSSCGTLSFLAPEVFRGTANAGPPLDVWSLGVILFAMLCGRLPFEGPDMIGTKRPRDAVIKARIMKCQYKLDDNLGPEVKDLVRRMLQVDPAERMTIPEIFNHVWVRVASTNHWAETHLLHLHQTSSRDSEHSNIFSSASATPNNNNNDFSSPYASRSKRINSNPQDLVNYSNEFKLRKESHSEVSTALNSKQSSRTDIETDRVKNTTRSQSSEEPPADSLDIVKELEGALHEIEEEPAQTAPAEPKSTASMIKLVPLRRNDGKQSKGLDDDDLHYHHPKSLNSADNHSSFRPSTTIAAGGRRNMNGLMKPTPEEPMPAIGGYGSPSTTTKNFSGVGKDIINRNSPRVEIADSKEKDKDSLYNLAMQGTKSLSSNIIHSTTDLRRNSNPTSDPVSPVPRSHPSSAVGMRKDVNAHRPVIPAGLASIQTHNTVLKMNGLSPTHSQLDNAANVASPSTSPLVSSNLRKGHHSNHNSGMYGSPSNVGSRPRFN